MNGASKFIANDYFIYVTIVISYNFNKGTKLSACSFEAGPRRNVWLSNCPMIAASRPEKSPGLRRLTRLRVADRNR